MKKTLLVTMEFPPQVGGIASYVYTLSGTLPPEDLVVLAPNHPEASRHDAGLAYTVIRRDFFFGPLVWPRWLRLFFHVRSVIRTHGIEQVFIHHALPVGYIGLLLHNLMAVPYVIFSHGTDIGKALQSPWKRRCIRYVADGALLVIFNSQSLQDRFIHVFPELGHKCRVLYPCPDPIFFESQDTSRLVALKRQYAITDRIVLLAVGRLVDGKGFPHLLRLLPTILSRVPQIVCLIVGDGPKLPDLEKQVQKLSLHNIVRFVGAVPHEAVLSFFGIADIFVLLTHPDEGREEGFGLVFLEAAAAGVPVVAGRGGGVSEAVIDQETGLVVDVYQEKQVVDAITTLLKDRAYARQLSERAKERVYEKFIWENQVTKLLEWLG